MRNNKQGRTVSDSMRLKYFLHDFPATTNARHEEQYKGFAVNGKEGKWFVGSFPIVFTSLKKAHDQVDRCLALRAELA